MVRRESVLETRDADELNRIRSKNDSDQKDSSAQVILDEFEENLLELHIEIHSTLHK